MPCTGVLKAMDCYCLNTTAWRGPNAMYCAESGKEGERWTAFVSEMPIQTETIKPPSKIPNGSRSRHRVAIFFRAE